MALAIESFSIREYVARTRSEEFEKCWPFAEEAKGRTLPPISVRKFRWWADELAAARAEAEAEEEVEEGRQARAPARGKQRAPKKRSIVELFAVAPPMEPAAAAGSAGETDGSDSSHDRRGEEEAMKKKAKKKKKRMKKKKKKIKVEICAAKQDKIHKPKTPFAADISQLLQCSLHKKRFMKTLQNPIHKGKKKLAAKSFPKKHKCIRNSKLIPRSQKSVAKALPVLSILKNRTRGLSSRKTGTAGDSQVGDTTKLHRDSVKRVSFSGKDDIIGHNDSCSPVELPQLRSLCKIFADVLAASSAMKKPSKSHKLPVTAEGAQVVNSCEINISRSVADKRVGTLPEMQQLNDAIGHVGPSEFMDSSNKNCNDAEKWSLIESVDLNQDVQSHGNLNHIDTSSSILSPDRSHSSSRVQIITHKEGLDSNTGFNAEESHQKISDTGSLPSVGNHVSWSDAMSSLPANKSSVGQPRSFLVMHRQHNERQPGPTIDPEIHIPNLQQVGFLSSKDSVGSMCSSVQSKRYEPSRLTSDLDKSGHLRVPSNPVSLYRDEYIDEDFFGLPLNSQGEFIKHSNNMFGFSEIFKKHSTVLGSGHSFSTSNSSEPRSSIDHVMLKGKFPRVAVYQKDLINQFPEQHYPASKLLTYGSGCIKLQGSERMRMQNNELIRGKDFILPCETDLMEVPNHGCREHNLIHHCINTMREKSQPERNFEHRIHPEIQPTMRLMGQNVTVGRSSKDCQGFDDGKIWTDKEIITENLPTLRVSDKACSRDWPEQEWVHPAYGVFQGNVLQPLESPSSIFYLPVESARSDLLPFDSRTQLMSRDGLPVPFRMHSSPGCSFSHPHRPLAMLNSNPATECVKTGLQVPVGLNHQDVCQHMILGSNHCKSNQNVSYSTASTFHPPFLNQGYVSLSQPSVARSSSNLPQWLLDAAQQTRNQRSSCPSYPKPIVGHQPCNISGTNFFPSSSPYVTSVLSFPVYSTNASQACAFSVPGSVVQTSAIPSVTANNSSPAGKATYQSKVKGKDGKKSSFSDFRGIDLAKRSRKRAASKDVEFLKAAKKPTLKMQEHSNAMTDQGEFEQLNMCTHLNSGTLDLLSCGSKVIDLSHSEMDIEKDEPRIAPMSSSSKLDGVSRSGPYKLSAGAKHILEPSQSKGHDNSRPVHSTVPFPMGNSSAGGSVSQTKAGKLYRF